uniref:Uncharacterized protein n=1 Tax=Trichobilharzia regenti TaxID=157069 RepID=A0AA85K7F7_TRIRE|nr:unnamed protein product [Trichobilharzia regenti]
MTWFKSADLMNPDKDTKELPKALWITAIVCGCIGTLLHIGLIFIRKLRAVYPFNLIIISVAIVLWIIVAVVYCLQIQWKYNLIMLFLTALIGVLPLFIGLKSKRLTDEGYFLFYILSVALIVIGIMFYILDRSKDFPFTAISAIFLSTGIAFGKCTLCSNLFCCSLIY